MENFPGLLEKSLRFYKFDHRVVLLKSSVVVKGRPKPFQFQPHWFDEHELITLIKSWWSELEVTGNADYVLHQNLKLLKVKIKGGCKKNLSTVEKKIKNLEGLISLLEIIEEQRLLDDNEVTSKHQLTEELHHALKTEENLGLLGRLVATNTLTFFTV